MGVQLGMTQRIYIDSDEWYPVYSFDTENRWGNQAGDVTDEELARLNHAFEEFDWAQDFLKKLRHRG